jgi:serine/threonine protein kinase/Tfp pilus assembly protein PilF
MIGETISHYRIIEKLGEGGMGVVYKAEDTRLKRSVALKFLSPDLMGSDEWKHRFIREAQAASALDHPSICTVHEIDEIDDQTFIAMSYIEGRSLAERIESGPLEAAEAVRIAIQVAEGLQRAHRKGIVHRDIKPANIMLTDDGHAKILDFGLAKLADRTRLTKTATIMGTVNYMSPEQARGEAVSHGADIWSLGVVLYEMLTGEIPFQGANDQAVIYSILNKEPGPVSSIRKDMLHALDESVQRMLRKESEERYEGMDSLIKDLKRARSDLAASPTPEGKSSPSIAVLPFENMSADPDQEYFCDGLAEELINALTQIEDLHVVARTSAFSFKGQQLDIREIGRKLNVATVLEGSVRKAGNRLRVTAQLVKVADGYHLWSERFDRELDDVFAIQDEITLAIVDELKPRLLGEDKAKLARRRAVDLEAYNLYLRGRWFRNQLTQEGFKKAIECFNQAIEKEPDYAPAYAGLAFCYTLLPVYGPFEPIKTIPKAREAALRALQIDDNLAEAHMSMAEIRSIYDWDRESGGREFKRAVELNPGDAFSRHRYAIFLMYMGRHDEAINEAERALELDPLSFPCNRDAGVVFCLAKEPDRAINVIRRTLEMDPNCSGAHLLLGIAYWFKSEYEEATAELQIEMEDSGGRDTAAQAMVGAIYALTGRRDEGMRIREDLLERSRREYVPAFFPAILSFALGETDRGFELLDKAYEEHDTFLSFLKTPFLLDLSDLRSDPRYIAMLKKIGLDK